MEYQGNRRTETPPPGVHGTGVHRHMGFFSLSCERINYYAKPGGRFCPTRVPAHAYLPFSIDIWPYRRFRALYLRLTVLTSILLLKTSEEP